MAEKVVVVGAGIGGLASAALLAQRGYQVTVLEKNATPGGRARIWKEQGFQFDMGPSWYLMPEVYERLFEQLGKKTSDYYELVPLHPSYRVHFGREPAVEITSDRDQTAATFEALEPGSSQQLQRYLAGAKVKYTTALRDFLYVDYRSVFQFFNRKVLAAGWQMGALRGLDATVRRHFADHRTRQLLEYAMVFLGTRPSQAPAVYSLLSHVDMTQGVFYPSGGFGAVVDALFRIAVEKGVHFEFNSEVSGFGYEGRNITSVYSQKGRFDADVIVMNADYHHGETSLLTPQRASYTPRYWRSRVATPSMLILYLGLSQRIPELAHHTLHFSEDWDTHFRAIFDTPEWPTSPCFYLCCPSRTDASVAPEGCENLFVLVPVAAGMDDSDRERYAETVLDHVELVTGVSIKPNIIVQRIFSQRDFAADYNAWKGSALGLAHTLNQTALFRPSIRSRNTDNLFYSGQYTHPGVGVPMVLIAAQLASEAVAESFPPGGAQNTTIFKKGSKTYFYSSLFFPPAVRREVFTLYAFVRTADDLVDAVPQNKEGFLAFRRAYEKALAGVPARDSIIDGFVSLSHRKKFDPAWAQAFLDAMEADLTKSRYDTLDETRTYMHGSAEVIGLFMCAVMGIPPQAFEAAEALGRSMQYINFIRDIAEDNALGRTYLPLAGSGLTDLAHLTALGQPKEFCDFVGKQSSIYLRWQEEARQGFSYLPPRLRIPVMTASHLYNWTARVIQRDPFVVYRRKVKPSKGRILLTLVGVSLRVALGMR